MSSLSLADAEVAPVYVHISPTWPRNPPPHARTPMALNEAMDNLASRLPPERLLFVSWSNAVHDDDATACEVRHADFADPELLLQQLPTFVGCVQLLGPGLLLLPARINSAQRRSLHSLADTAGLLHDSVGSS